MTSESTYHREHLNSIQKITHTETKRITRNTHNRYHNVLSQCKYTMEAYGWWNMACLQSISSTNPSDTTLRQASWIMGEFGTSSSNRSVCSWAYGAKFFRSRYGTSSTEKYQTIHTGEYVWNQISFMQHSSVRKTVEYTIKKNNTEHQTRHYERHGRNKMEKSDLQTSINF